MHKRLAELRYSKQLSADRLIEIMCSMWDGGEKERRKKSNANAKPGLW